jgi:hypothetical protein
MTSKGSDEGVYQPLTAEGRQEDRDVLIEWLNSAADSQSYQRVSRLLHNILAATGLFGAAFGAAVHETLRDLEEWHTNMPAETKEIPRRKRQRRPEIEKLLGSIEAAVKGYVFHPRLTLQSGIGQGWWFDLVGESVPGDYKLTLDGGRRVYEADAVFRVLHLTSDGLLKRVRQCLTCRKWFYAHPPHKLYCSKPCQQKNFASDPRQKKKHAERQRKFRLRQKQEYDRARRDAQTLARKPNRK